MPTPTHRARLHLQAAGQLYPRAWQQIDAFRAGPHARRGWPDHVFCPLAGAAAVVSGGDPHGVPPRLIGDIARLGALAAWRPTQGIYRFDPDLYAALVGSPPTGNLPCALLHHLPAWCVYIETDPAQTDGLYGFFAHLEYDLNYHREELRLLLDSDAGFTPLPLHLGPWVSMATETCG